MKENLKLRSEFYYWTRIFFRKQKFLEISTPILTKDSKEGARPFLIPSRKHSKRKFALAQSPQVYKQALMASYIERYFQIAKTFRNEDVRSDRQPEFEQLDVEMSYITQKQLLNLVE